MSYNANTDHPDSLELRGRELDDWIRYTDDEGMERQLLQARVDLSEALAIRLEPVGGWPSEADRDAKASAVRSAAMRLLRLGLEPAERGHLLQMLKLAERYPDVGNPGCNRDVLRLVTAAAGPCDQAEVWTHPAFSLMRELMAEIERLDNEDCSKRVEDSTDGGTI